MTCRELDSQELVAVALTAMTDNLSDAFKQAEWDFVADTGHAQRSDSP